MQNAKLFEIAKDIEGLSYNDWQKLKMAVDLAFARKKGEFERELKLSDDIPDIIIQQFG